MKEKLVDLNSRKDSTTAVVTLGDKTFRISRVVIAARVLYSNYLITIRDFFDGYSKVKNEEDERRLMESYSSIAEKTNDRLLEIIELILVKNGYSFDKAWWEDNADIVDLRGFIDACISKDASSAGVKKKQK